MKHTNLTVLLSVLGLALAGCQDATEPTTQAAAPAPAAAAAVPAGENVGDDKATPGATALAVDTIRMADELAAVAIDRGDAAMLIQAARIKASVSTQDAEVAVEQGAGEEGDKDEASNDYSVTGLLDRAEVLAHGNDTLLAMVTEARSEAARTRGRVGGPGHSNNRVLAHATNTYTSISFRAGEPARIWLVGDGDTDLDLYVYDQNGNRICASLGAWDREACAWTPRWTGPFTIRVRNLGGVWNAYTMTTN